jgi:broad specificity phosphatase PhoE
MATIRADPQAVDAFVSYSDKDRVKVVPLVDTLIDRGLRVWIDKYKVPGGGDYTQEIPGAIGRSKLVLLFASANAFGSRNVKRELDLAWRKQKPVIPVFLEPAEVPEGFEWHLEAVQPVHIHNEPRERWTDIICQPLAHLEIALGAPGVTSEAGMDSRSAALPGGRPGSMSVGPLMPYLVDRVEQERQLREALMRHAQTHDRRPLLLVSHGSVQQAIHEYLHRVEKVSLPRALRHVRYCDHIKWVDLPWTRDDWQKDPAGTLHALQADVEAEVQAAPGSWPNGVAEAAMISRSVLVFCYRLTWQQWNETHFTTLKAWAQAWGCLPDLSPGYPVIVFCTVQHDPPPAGLLARFQWRKRGRSIAAALVELERLGNASLAVSVLPELGNVVFSDIEYWIMHEVRPHDPMRMIRQVRSILNDPELFAGSGVPMNRLLDRLAAVLEEAAREQSRCRL